MADDNEIVDVAVNKETAEFFHIIKEGLVNNPAHFLKYVVDSIIENATPDGIVDDFTSDFHDFIFKGKRSGDDKRVIKWCIKNLRELQTLVHEEKGKCSDWGILGIILMHDYIYTSKERDVVYFIQNPNNLVKIGFTSNLPERLKSLINSSGAKLVVLYTFTPVHTDIAYIESRLHNHYNRHRVVGEWFEIEPNIREFSQLCVKFDMGN